MFITMPISFQGRLTRYIGRLHRDYENKTQIKVYDYVDVHIPQLHRMFQKRLKVYKSEGYKVIENNETVEFDHVIYDKANYEYYLHASMSQANKNIILFTNECKINRIQKIYSFLISLYTKGIKIYICTNKSFDDHTTHYLEEISTRILESNISINAILIDEKELWTCSSSYLGIQNNDLFYLRTKDIAIIEELKSQINLI